MKPDTCNCCKPPTGGTPIDIDNRPGLSAVAYRVGTFANFRQTMFHAISRSAELRGLSTRQSDDYAITILELWSAIADILTFYQERSANEAFLRTARLRDSVLRMARMIGYELAPGSAATALLSFTADKGKQVQVPVGLRVQSVPGQDEKPQKYETLETITVYDWLNEQMVFPAPVGTNPLARGSTAAYLSAGEDGLTIAENLVKDDRVFLFNSAGTEPVEELVVKKIEAEHEHMRVSWSSPVQGTQWDMTTKCFKLVRSFRLFGYNVQPSYPKPSPSTGIIQSWTIQEIHTGTPINNNSFAVAGGSQLHLDSRYDDLKVGTLLLLADGTTQQKLLTVTAVDQDDQTLGSVTDTVTRVTVTSAFSQINDRRQVVVHELTGPPISFWGFSYPDIIESATVYIPGSRIDVESIEIARPIEKNAYEEGYTVKLTDIEKGRQAILMDKNDVPIVSTIKKVDITGNEIVFDATHEDAETVYLLLLDRDSAMCITGLCSASLEAFQILSSTTPSLCVTIGNIGPRTITLSGPLNSVNDVASSLENALQPADTDPVFAHATVRVLDDNWLIVLPGDYVSTIKFSKTLSDDTTIVELGFDEDQTELLTGLMSGELDPVLAYTEASPQLSVRIGSLESQVIDLDVAATTLVDIANDLQSKLNVAGIAPFFKYSRVLVIDQRRVVVFPGMIGTNHQDYLKIELSPNSAITLNRSSAMLLGNVASASHGETVESEVLGDADPTIPFQKFTLKKSPVTFVPSSGEGGVDNTLQLFVNDVLWHEVNSLFGKGSAEAVYRTFINNEAEMSVRFGDGITGARPPRGRANVVARYRQGLGLEGRVCAGALKTLLDKPKGLKTVINPAGADGGADPETLDNARENAPTTVRTFDRAVSLLDFEDLARSRSEVAKAKVTWVWSRASRVVHLTIAGQNGGIFSSTALERIHAGLTTQRDPNRQLLVDNYKTIPILITATLNIDAIYVAPKVADATRSTLLEALSFESLEFAQSIHLSDVYAILQNVSGVVSVDIDLFMFKQKADVTDAGFDNFLDDRGIRRLADGTPELVQNHLWILPAQPNKVLNNPMVLSAEQASVESPSHDVIIITKGGLPG
ncbi:MAG: baseplate J/gp47 family protein [Candidatus Scalindua rubra]|uniref:Uncharacterized protein n=1 Tax=Candidatus Scalindua brodae TaxID=237368 RepID=A0A0B0EQK2_9BACT|nr:MAG: hypothetical protein SCABRO_00839 [Candidatus Scalindua brodae]MBZ0108122.1 baseplate J/gp47 family protein [Candidatus Scalindua rubra]TWU31259.1 hypothetical protein S225a_22050 [Candidatus Brocadiaceae bacterium S225]